MPEMQDPSRGDTTDERGGPDETSHERLTTIPTSAVPHLPRRALDAELREIKDHVLRMGAMVESQIRAAIDALVGHDADAAVEVMRGDGAVNEQQRVVTALISATIATQQPVARDLRFLLSLDHVAYELERIGDHAASVAKQARRLAPEPPLKEYVDLPRMGQLTAELVNGILRALVDVDERLAREVALKDDEVDAIYHRTFDEVVRLMQQDPANVERGARIILASHYIERIGDRVTNIAEDIVFLASGEVEDLNP
jgi:phosphate transport system protein